MYDISTAATLCGENNSDVNDITSNEKKPKVFCASRGKWLAIAVGCDINLFDLAFGIEHKANISFKESDEVINLQFFPDDDLFLAVLSSGVIVVCMPNVKSSNADKAAPLMIQEAILPPISACSISIVSELEKYVICILECKGSAHFLEMDKLSTVVKSELDWINPIKLTFSSDKIGAEHVIWMLGAFLFFPQRKGDRVKISPVQCFSNEMFSVWFKLCNDIKTIKNLGKLVIALTSNNQLIFYNNVNLNELYTMDLSFADSNNGRGDLMMDTRKAIDFEFLDVKNFCELQSACRILFTVKTEEGNEFVLKSLESPSILFNSVCADDVVLIPHATPGDDSNIIFVEAYPKSGPNNIIVRFVSEAQPALRLKRLLDNGRFDEALDFAKTHELSLDIVYVAKIRKCQEQILSEAGCNESVFEELMKYLALISDHDEACDFCLAVLQNADKYEHIVKVLEFTQKEKIKDSDTVHAISDFRYELASYRMLYGASQAKYDRDSEWPVFLTAENHMSLFNAFCEKGKISEARIVFNRYPSEVFTYFSSAGAIDRLLSFFSINIAENPASNVAISDFIESDLLKYFLFGPNLDASVSNSKNLFTFLVDTAMSLEHTQIKFFPENALFFALSFSRGLDLLKQNCLTSDQQVEPILVLDKLDVDTYDESFPSGRLNVFIRNLKSLVRIHRVYQCPMSYSQYLNCDVNSICSSILDRVRTAQSVRDHIESFVFPYMLEHNLDKNEMLYRYIKNLASKLYCGGAQYSNSWDQLCLQIAENIGDADLRCKAVIEIAAGSIPPWSEQLMNVVKNALTHVEDVDPALIQRLRVECKRAELGQIFVAYHIPLNFRSAVIGLMSLRALLQFIFRNSDKEPAVRLNDAFKILSIYESLMGRMMLTRVECYQLYAISIVMQLQDEYDLSKLTDFFHLIKSVEERSEVAWKLTYYLTSLIRETTAQKVKEQRLIWLASTLCILERFVLKETYNVNCVAQKVRNIRRLQVSHDLIIGFATLDNEDKCVQHLINYITEYTTKKSLSEVVTFGYLFLLSLRRIFDTILKMQIKEGLTQASLATLEFYVEHQLEPDVVDLNTCLYVYTTALWNITKAAVETGTEFQPLVQIVKIFKDTLPILLDWSMKFKSIQHVEDFARINRYISLLNNILDLCVVDKNEPIERDDLKSSGNFELEKAEKVYTNRRRIGAFLPSNENSFFDHNTVIRNAAIVASSIVQQPIESDNFDNEMVEYWNRLFDSLSTHKLLEITARQFAHSLPCFASIREINGPTLSLRNSVSELCQKILNVSTADLLLAAHLLLHLSINEMKSVLQELRRWVTSNRKSVRISLNVIRLSLFVLIEAKDYTLQQQLTNIFETTLWQKRFSKLGITVLSANQLRKEAALELVGEFVKVLISPSVLKTFCDEMKVPNHIMLTYAIELCKVSSSFTKDRERFQQTIATAKRALRDVEVDEDTIQEVMNVINSLCPYNYEVLELLLKQMDEWVKGRRAEYETWTKDRLLLLSFLFVAKRTKGYTEEEVRWYRNRSNNRGFDITGMNSMRIDDETSSLLDEDQTAVPNTITSLLGGLYRKQDVFEANFPPLSGDRLPFHLFLSSEPKEKTTQAIIHHEISIYNVLGWTSIIEETTEILNQSRTSLIVIAISNDVSDAIKYKRELTEYDLEQIHTLVVRDLDRRVIILKSLGQRFRKLQLCDIKISVFKVCYEIAKDSVEQLSGDDKKDCIAYRDALKRTLAQSITDLLMSKNKLLNTNTSALSSDPIPLISYICSNCIDWNNDLNIELHFRIVEEIAKVNDVDLNAVYDELILSWLPGSEGIEVGNTHTDPDATIDFMGTESVAAHSGANSAVDELPLPVLYSDPSLSKIVFLLKKCDPEKKARTIYQKFQQGSTQTPGDYLTKIRTACCLIRYLTNDQMVEILSMDKNQFCVELIQLLSHRLLSVCRIGISVRDFMSSDKAEFVRSILSPHSFRQTPEIARLIISVIVDNDIKDIALIDKAAFRLLQLRMMRPLMILLEYTRKFDSAKSIANIGAYYAKTFEWNYEQIEDFYEEDSDRDRKMVSLVYSIVGCPVEGGTNFLRLKTLFSRMPFAAALVSIAASSTEKVSDLKFTQATSSKDILLNRECI